MKFTSIKNHHNDISAALAAGVRHLHISGGRYVVKTLRLPSGTHIKADPDAHIRFDDGAGSDASCHLLTNSDPSGGNEDITIDGGIWDGNNPANPRGPNQPGSFSGVPLSFINVRNLTLKNLTLTDPDAYYIRMGEVSGFHIENIRFKADHIRPNQDGIHMGGYCRDGSIRNLLASGTGITQDDMVALVADDLMDLSPNIGLKCGPFRNIHVETLRADDCHSFVRLGSVFHEIIDIVIRDVRGGCRVSAINGDALRYCAGPVFDPTDPKYAHGVGLFENVAISDFQVHKTAETGLPMFMIESRLRNFTLKNLVRDDTKHQDHVSDFVRLKHIETKSLNLNGQPRALKSDETLHYRESRLDNLTVYESVVEPGILQKTKEKL